MEPVELFNAGNDSRSNRNDSIQELAFLDLKYEVENIRPGMEDETLTVLDGVSGQANSREMLALVRKQNLRGVSWGTCTHNIDNVYVTVFFYFYRRPRGNVAVPRRVRARFEGNLGTSASLTRFPPYPIRSRRTRGVY